MPLRSSIGLLLALALAVVTARADDAVREPAGSRDNPVLLAPRGAVTTALDSTGAEIAVIEVRAARLRSQAANGRIELSERDLDTQDVTSAADLGVLLPATRVNVNSRGEAVIQMRGAPERHVRVLLDDIPLTVPWDERVDLSMIPLHAIGSVEAQRGMASALNGPNALAGTVRLGTRDVTEGASGTQLAARVGEAEAFEAKVMHARRKNGWNVLGAVTWRDRGATLAPSELGQALHQYSGRSRTNTQLEQVAFLTRLGRDFDGGGSLRLVLLGADGGKGVAPETHREDARFWRYPKTQRFLTGLSLLTPVGDRWSLRASASGDYFRQQIQEFDDASYSGPALEPGVEFEDGRDRTANAHASLRRSLGERSSLGLAADFRYTQHREQLEFDGPELSYAQTLASWTAEWRGRVAPSVQVTVGGGYEIAATPETADKPSRDATTAPVFQAGAAWALDSRTDLRASLSRRSRFPSLRELFSGALGRFVPSPELKAEEQDLVEASIEMRGSRATATAGLFASWLDGSIEKVSLEGRQFQRRNVDSIRTLGFEVHAVGRVWRRLQAQLHHTFLFARARENGAYSGLVEDRPDYLSRASLSWSDPSGLGLRLETQVVGLRHSADVNDSLDGLRPLPPQASWNARVSFTTFPSGVWSQVEVFLRVNNLFDQRVDSQTGLPEPGRTAWAGLRVSLGDG